MTWDIAYLLALLVVALVLFSRDVLPLDVVALILLLLLVLPPGLLTATEALAGFGSETIVTLASLFVLTAGVTRTGCVERLGLRIAGLGREHPVALIRLLLVGATAISAWISNTVTTAAMLPLALGSAQRAGLPVSRVLMPLAFATILASGVTVISTSTVLVVAGELPKYGLPTIGFFEMTPVALVIMAVGLLYLIFVAPRLIPERTAAGDTTESATGVVDRYALRTYLTEAIISPGSPMAGQRLGESRLGEAIDLVVVGLRRGETRILAPRPGVLLAEGDILLLEGRAKDVLAIKDAAGIEIKPEMALSDPDFVSEDVRMVEALVLPRSDLLGGTLEDVRFRQRTGITVLGIHSSGVGRARKPLSRHRLEAGDILLLQGHRRDLERLDDDNLLQLEDKSGHHPRTPKATIAASVFIGAILLASSGLLPMSIALLLGMPALILTRCLTTEEAYESIDWRLLVMIAAMMAFGSAMSKTGTADWLAGLVVTWISPLGGLAVLAAFFVLTVVLTQPMSNQAAALVLLPVAVQTAAVMGIEPRPLVMSVTFAASCSFLTPLEPSCVLVYGPGGYRFFDFVRVGGLLTVVVFAIAMLLIPLFWPLVEVTAG